MSERVIRTVLGDVPAGQIGITDSHDHLIRSGGPEVRIDPAFLMDDLEAAKKEFDSFLKAGGRTMVCMDPIGCGRNVPKMLQLAEYFRGRGHIIMTTGFQKGSLYDPRTSFLATVEVKKVVEMMVAEITEGMDRHSYNGPVVERTQAKAGLIKGGTSYRLITKLEEKALQVAALTQRETGCPISIHTDFGTMGPEILQILREHGGSPEHTVLCHVQRNPDRYYYKLLLDQGVNLCFEEADKAQYRSDTEIAESIRWLVDQGYQDQLLLGMDAGRIEGLAAYMEPKGWANGLDYMLNRFVPVLKWAGVGDGAVDKLLKVNPARVFSMWN